MSASRRFHSRRVPGDKGVFALMSEAKAAAAAAGKQVVDLSVGTPDLAPPPEAIEALRASVDDLTTYKYCLRDGTMPLLEAATEWFASRYGVRLDPATQALSLIGSQEGLAHLLMAVADPGEGVLMLPIGYACYLPAITIAGLRPRFLPLPDDGSFLPDFDAVPASLAAGCRALLLNYPNNPTSAVADGAFWRRALEFARRHDLLLINDNPYCCQVYSEDALAASALAQPGALERTVELFSMAKSYQLGGCRLGFALGNADAIAALEAVKAPVDFNQWLGIQRMGIACLKLPQSRLVEYAQIFRARAAALTAALRAHAGWEAPMPRACMYLFAPLPPGFSDDARFCLELLGQTGVALSPGSAFGPAGAGHVRFALVRDEGVLAEAARAIGRFLASPEAARLRGRGGSEGGANGGPAADVAAAAGVSG
ncbi:succinyldiaminopimelate aminotransferase [Raphidocelis subcapitata]|uniref:Succinyldiaminopimelate aminotransferase n=1 Tax=Raphidocelis subcapitata TaxID=307507 RepID=A0A2V0NJU8_9CHLO|nr:succinyldiaminopimelate aminotransferase [Raphidocelis subcapitata]|eukprot:GBF87524.1 succinyldiaminopimelate aminotransferase [Raphidocelis subcapitata]